MSTATEAVKSGTAAPVRCQRIGCDAVFTDDDNPEGSCQYHPSVSSSSSSSDLPSPPKNLVPGQDNYESHHCFKSQIERGWHLLACPEYLRRPCSSTTRLDSSIFVLRFRGVARACTQAGTYLAARFNSVVANSKHNVGNFQFEVPCL